MPDVSIHPLTASDIPLIAGWMAATPLWQRYRLTEAGTRSALEQALSRADLLLVADVDHENGQACGLAWCLPEGAFGRRTGITSVSEWRRSPSRFDRTGLPQAFRCGNRQK